jgi:6-phospho-beta-glucosidase
VRARYGGLNHLGWITSFELDGAEMIGDLIGRFGELQQAAPHLAPFDAEMVRRVGAIPTEYVYYYYDPQRYVDDVRRAGTSRGEDVLGLNEELLTAIGKGFAEGDVQSAWSAYAGLLGVRRDTYMKTDTQGASGQAEARAARAAAGPIPIKAEEVGGYEGLALRVIDGLAGRRASDVIVNMRNDGALDFLEPDDIVEIPARVDSDGLKQLPPAELPGSCRSLVLAVKEYERGIVEAAMTGDAGLAAVALSQHPLVPGIKAARELMTDYIDQHGEHLAYLAS